MILDLTKSQLFKVHPDVRFSEEYQLPHKTWTDIWQKYKLLDYSHSDLIEYIFIKYGRRLSHKSIERWIFRTEIFSIANPWIKKGVKHVNSLIFKELEQRLMNELVETIKSGDSSNSRIIIH